MRPFGFDRRSAVDSPQRPVHYRYGTLNNRDNRSIILMDREFHLAKEGSCRELGFGSE